MAYNPFDDIIEQDPAYMADGGTRAGIIKPVTTDQGPRYISQAIADFYGMLTPEEELKQQYTAKEESQQKLLQESQPMIQAIQAMQPNSREQLLAIKNLEQDLYNRGYQNFNIQEILGMTGQFLYGDQRKAFDKLAAAEPLTSEDRMAIAFAPLDLLDFIAPGIVTKLAKRGFTKVDDVLKASADIPEVKQVQDYFAGRQYTPEGVMYAPETGGSGGFTPRPGVSIEQQKRLKAQEEETLKLAEILKKDLDEDKNLTMRQLVEKYNLQGITLQGRQDLKKTSSELLKKEVPELYKARTAQSQKNIGLQKGKAGDEQLLEYLQKKRESGEKFESFTKIADDLVNLKETDPRLKVVNRKSLTKRYNENPEFKELFDEIIDRPEKVQDATDKFQAAYSKVPVENRLQMLGVENIRDINPKMFDEITMLSKDFSKGPIRPNNLFMKFMYDKYRSIKESGARGIQSEDDFFTKMKYSEKDLQDLRSEFSDYAMLERDRLYMQNEGQNFLQKLSENPKYRPYLVNDEGQLDQQLFRVNKLHDVPLFQTRVEGKGRLKKVGRFLNTGTDPEFLNPHFQPYNRLQVDLDPTINKLADVLNQKGLMDKAANMNATVIKKVKDKKGRLVTPADRVNFITEGIVELINNKGFNLNPKGKKQSEFLKEVAAAIDDIYKERGIRSIVPTQKGAKKDSMVFGVENPKEIGVDTKIDQYKEAILNALNYAVENKISPKDFRTTPKREGGLGYMKFLNKGGAVKMAIGGDPLQNLNQQQYSPDPAFDEDYFQQAVESGNLQAANLLNLFKVFKKPKAMATPSNIQMVKDANKVLPESIPGGQQVAPLQAGKQDFYFKSYLLDQLADPNAPKASSPQGWIDYLQKGKKVPESELLDTGIVQYLEDTEKFYPGKKITRQEIQDLYDTSPLGNIEVRVKDARPTIELSDVPPGENTRDYLDFYANQGKAKHKRAGNAQIDEGAENYFEVVVNVPSLPGQEKAFFESSHYGEPNVLGFTRVGTYKNAGNETVAVIQEMQTDMLTEVRKEQERLTAMLSYLKKRRADLEDSIQRSRQNGYPAEYEENNLRQFDTQYPPEKLKALEETTLIEPYPNIAAKDMIPQKTKSLNDIQEEINKLMMSNVEQYIEPAYKTKVYDLAQQQNFLLEELNNMNRSSNYKQFMEGFQVPATKDIDELKAIANRSYPPSNVRNVKTFPPIPFNKQADYVDLLLKSTIQAAKQKGINKVAIMPADVGANPRWGKTSDEAKLKFQNLYDKVGVQQLKNIAKKYNGAVEVEKIIDPTKSDFGIRYFNKGINGEYQLLKEDVLSPNLSFGEQKMFADEQLARMAHDMGSNNVILHRETSPGQSMDYWVQPTGPSQGVPKKDRTFELVPVGPGDDINSAEIKIEDFKPNEVDMYTITFDPSQLDEPMYLFKKKSGGSIDKDRLVSITDIYGEYGR